MRKGKITILTMQKKGQVLIQKDGYVGRFFGYYRVSHSFSVTHLSTGCSVAVFDLAKQARKFIQACNDTTFPVSWDASENPDDYRANVDILKNLISEVKHNWGY